jgi:hypothetical protein
LSRPRRVPKYPRDADLRDYCDEDERDQGDDQSDGARPDADRRKGECQKYETETRLHPSEDL